jgi:hypothetical protein
MLTHVTFIVLCWDSTGDDSSILSERHISVANKHLLAVLCHVVSCETVLYFLYEVLRPPTANRKQQRVSRLFFNPPRLGKHAARAPHEGNSLIT